MKIDESASMENFVNSGVRRIVGIILISVSSQVSGAGWTTADTIKLVQPRNNGDIYITFDSGAAAGNPMSCVNTSTHRVTAATAAAAGGDTLVASILLAMATRQTLRIYSNACSGNYNSIIYTEITP